MARARVLGFGFACCLILALSARPASAEEPKSESSPPPPKLKGVYFPNEPNKQKEQPIRPETYKQGATEPPVVVPEDERAIARLKRAENEWGTSFQLGWFFLSQSTKHVFLTPVSGQLEARRTGSSFLAGRGRIEEFAPWVPVSFLASASAATGSAQVTPTSGSTLNYSDMTAIDLRGLAEARIHLLPRSWATDVAIGADLEGAIVTQATLSGPTDQLDSQNRKFLSWAPKLSIRVYPEPGWAVEAEGGRSLLLKASGEGDARAAYWMRATAGLRAIRYLEAGQGIGIGATYAREQARWERSSPTAMVDSQAASDFQVNLFWQREF